jgi:hypothetical protein
MKGEIGCAAFLDLNIQRRRHHHADVAFAGQVRERRLDTRTQMGKWHGGTYREAQLRHALMQQIQDGRGLRNMAETVAGYGNDEMGHGVRQCS